MNNSYEQRSSHAEQRSVYGEGLRVRLFVHPSNSQVEQDFGPESHCHGKPRYRSAPLS